MGTRNSGYDRASQNWYQEPPQCAQVLLNEVPFAGGVHDPCCGKGTIVAVAQSRGIEATGADIEDRVNGRFPRRDFFADGGRYPNIVFNPPNDKRRGINMLAGPHSSLQIFCGRRGVTCCLRGPRWSWC